MDLYEMDEHLQELTPHQLKIVQAVYNGGGVWLTRARVARALGKRRLTPYDINCLKMLTEKAIIETSTQPTTAPGSDFAYVYHMPDDVAEVLQEWADMREQELRQRRRRPIRLTEE